MKHFLIIGIHSWLNSLVHELPEDFLIIMEPCYQLKLVLQIFWKL